MKTKEISQREQFEKSAWKGEGNFKLFQSSVFDVIYRYDPQNNKYDFISPSVELQTGYTVEEFSSDPERITQRITHPKDLAKVRAEVEQRIAGGSSGRPFRVEYRITRKDGREIWVSDQKTLEFTTDGKLYRINGVVRDITKRKLAEEAVRNAEREKATILASLSEHVVYQDTHMRILWANRAAADSVGLMPDQLAGRRCYEVWPQRTQPCPDCPVAKARQTGQPQEGEVTTPDGRVWFIRGYPVRDGSNEIVGVVETTLDITERKRAEEALKETNARLQTLILAIPDVVYFKDAQGRNLVVNKAFEELVGLKQEEIVGKTDDKLFPPDLAACCRQSDQEVRSTGSPVHSEEQYINKKGKSLFFDTIKVPIRDDQGTVAGFMGVSRDVTYRKEAEEKLRWELEVSTALAKLSNSLITPSSTVQDIAEIVLDYAKLLTKSEHGYVSSIDPQTRDNVGHTLTKMMGNQCLVTGEDRRIVFRLGSDGLYPGLWGHALNTCKPFYTNSPEAHQASKGTPEGHIPIENVLSVPAMIGEELVGQIALANSNKGYTERDLKAIQRLVDLYALAVQRKRVEGVLRESEAKYRTLFESSIEGIAITKGNRILAANRALLDTFGFTALEEFTREPLLNYVAPEHGKSIQHRLKKREKGEPLGPRLECSVVRKDGVIRDLEISTTEVLIRGEKHMLSTFHDITERKRAEVALQESEEKFRSLAEESPNMIFINKTGKVVYVNEKCEEIMGYAREEFYSPDFDFLTLIAPEFRESVETNFSRHEKGGEVAPFEYALITRQGKRIEAILNTKLIKYGGESVILGIVTDITERKRAEEALRESEEKYRTFFNTSPDGIAITTLDGKILDANQAYQNMLGYTLEELKELNYQQFTPTKWHEAEAKQIKAFMIAGYGTFEKEYIRKDGTIFPVSLTAWLIRDKQGNPSKIGAFFKDITDPKRAEEKLKDYTRQIEEKNLELKIKNLELTATRAQLVQKEKLRALGQMASGLAHNFNNLLAIILGRAQLLQRKAKDLEIEKGLKSIERAAVDASSTIRRIQDFTRVRKDQEFGWVDIDGVIDDVLALTKHQWKDQALADGVNIKLEVQKDRRRLAPVAGDESELREAFASIVLNAVDAMPEGGKIVIRTRTNRKSVSVYFIDSGIGIPAEARQKIFDPFFTTKGVRSTGLGLSVAYGIIQRHQGDIQIESKPGEGTTVIVRLPVSEILGKEERKEEGSEKLPAQKTPVNILVIEDEMDVRELLFDILTSAHYKVEVASDGSQGLEICRKEKFDIVLTDLGMPEISGWEVAKQIKGIDSSTTVLLITGWGVEMEEEKLKESGIDRVITKPVRVGDLLNLVSEMLESKKKIKQAGKDARGYPVDSKETEI
jgi:PAS domain S-box-containing protein